MSGLGALRDWFAGNGRYMDLSGSMGHDHFWIAATVALDCAVAGGCVLIALYWSRISRDVPPTPAKRALGNLRNLFLICGVCGYAFIPLKMVWPAWRLYDLVLIAVALYTWRYVWGARDLRTVYSELGRATQLAHDLEASREESKRKTFFLNAVSHDLRSPLNRLTLQSNLVELGAANGDRETVRSAVREIQHSARAAAELLDGLLEFARLDAGTECATSVPVDVGAVVGSVIAASSVAATAKGLSIRANVPVDLVVQADRQRLERILSNLVSNAVKFTDQGEVRIEVERSARRLRLHVIDTGIGISPEHRERLFEEFYQVHNSERNPGKGFGLGLSIARRMARQMGGDVTVESAVGHGSRFTVVLPLVAPGPETSQFGPGSVAEPSLASAHAQPAAAQA